MTEQEAVKNLENTIRHIQRRKYCQSDCGECPYFTTEQTLVESYGVAIKALEEIQQYRALGTVEELRACEPNVFVSMQLERLRVTKMLIGGLPDGYPMPMTKE